MVSRDQATQVLHQAYNEACNVQAPVCSHQDFIDLIVDGNHLTYKYVLFTALLSKATNPNINPLCLQKKSKLPGSYDARTVCHEVIVPFEKTILNKALGGSNEPFLNKPARYTELNKNNAVRRGNDQNLLFALCDNLPLIISADDAYQCLVYFLCKVIKHGIEMARLSTFAIPLCSNSPIRLSAYINDALNNSFEGEILTLMVAGVYYLKYRAIPNTLIDVHPVNQSGKSSKEISDLDIYINNRLVVSNELKDKVYSEIDVRHAADKVIQANGNNMFFIVGPRGVNNDIIHPSLIEEYALRNFMLHILSFHDFFSVMIPTIPVINCKEFMQFIFNIAHETKFKEDVILYLDNLAKKHFDLHRR